MAVDQKFNRREFIERSTLAAGTVFMPLHSLARGASDTGTVSLQVSGDAQSGHGVQILHRGRVIAHHHGGGEFSALFQNTERSLEDAVDTWKASAWQGNETKLTLTGQVLLPNLRTTVLVQIEYEVLSSQIVRKTIRLVQNDNFTLLYKLTNRLEPQSEPTKLWSFDQVDCRGGALHEYFPAAGFRTRDGITVGLLTDAGHRNKWSRIIRRDGIPTKPAPAEIPDLNLYVLPTVEERAKSGFYIQQTFGEETRQVPGRHHKQRVQLPAPANWNRRGAIHIEQPVDVVKLSPAARNDRVLLPFKAKDGDVFSIRLKYRCNAPISVRVWDVDEQQEMRSDITLFNDVTPASASVFREFNHSFVVPSMQGVSAALVIALAETDEASSLPSMEVSDIEVFQIETKQAPYHRLEMGVAEAKNVFIFVDEKASDTLRDYRLTSQLRLADALGFKGGETEKVVYADTMMLCWSADLDGRRPMLAPSIWYSAAGEMYLRDSFFALNGLHDRELNEGVFKLWADNQGTDGAINTLVEPGIANLERKSNDSTPLWLMWALLNKRRFGTALPMEKLRLAANYCLATYDPKREAVCNAKFVIGQLDIVSYPEGTNILCENQGMLAVLLRTIRELQIPGVSASISESYIAKAEQIYRSHYDASRGFMLPARDIHDAIGFSDIFPEFLSLWLFKRKILTDKMVTSHLDKIPLMLPNNNCPYPGEGGTARPIFIGLSADAPKWHYFTERWHPMAADAYATSYAGHASDGIYYNGGSWMRLEVCGYVAGKIHGWKRADRAIANRLWAEINTDPNYPTSQEYLATDSKNPSYGQHRVFAWNSFVLQALEMVGMRHPEMDPGYSKSVMRSARLPEARPR